MFLFVVVGLSILLGVTPVFGAFAAGIVAGRMSDETEIEARESIKWFSLASFIPIYFAIVGFRLDLIQNLSVSFLLFFLLSSCLIKGLSIYTGARAAGKPHPDALNLAVALNARGGPGIVIASLAFDAGIISQGFFAILVLVAVLTSLIAGSWLGRIARSGQGFL
jgi:Kef-type K+ transport system membrane component KefB